VSNGDVGYRGRDRKRFFIIHNPNAGRSARLLFHETVLRLKNSGATVDILDTTRHGQGTEASAQAARSGNFDVIAAAGGDGTVHDVAEGLIGHPVPLGIIPMGTGNVFAREVGLTQPAHRIARTLLEGKIRTIPVGQVNGRPFLFVVGIGFDAEAVRLFESEGTRSYGQVGFVWPVLRALRSYEDKPLKVTTVDCVQEAQWVLVTRIKRYAGNLILARDADLHDTHLHLLCLRGNGMLNRAHQLAALALGVIDRDPAVHAETVEWVRIEGDPRVPVQVDGEILGQLPLSIGLHSDRLKIIFPWPQ